MEAQHQESKKLKKPTKIVGVSDIFNKTHVICMYCKPQRFSNLISLLVD